MRYKVPDGEWIELVAVVRTLAENRLDDDHTLEIELFAKALWYGAEEVMPAIRRVLDDPLQPPDNKRRLLYLVDALRRFFRPTAKLLAEIRFLLYEFSALKCAKVISSSDAWGVAAEQPKINLLSPLTKFCSSEYADLLGIKCGRCLIKTRRQIADEIADAKQLPRVPHDAPAFQLIAFLKRQTTK